jgi:hypothetical protein
VRRVLLLCPEALVAQQQGVGIRLLEMARLLAHEHVVTLLAPGIAADVVAPEGVVLRRFDDVQAQAELAAAEIVLLHGHVSAWYFEALAATRRSPAPALVVDLYDPFLVENLQYSASLGADIYRRDRAFLLSQLAAGDFFLASSEAQRAFYAGVLIGMDGFTPADYTSDRTLGRLIAIAPFGVHADPPGALRGGALRGLVPGLEPGDELVAFGGVYDWYDPDTLLDALALLLPRHPRLRVLFNANPNPASTPQAALARVERRAEALGWNGRHVFVLPWFPYARRAAYLGDADLAVCLHRPSLETTLALRTRLLDFLHLGLPIVATEGGASAELLRASGGGLLVPPGEPQALADALAALLAAPERRHALGTAGRAFVLRECRWEQTLAPLLEFCRAPWRRTRSESGARSGTTWRGGTLAAVLRRWRAHRMARVR